MKKIIFLLCLPILVFSQNFKTVSGTIIASDTDEPLAFATVYVISDDGSIFHGLTDEIGAYRIDYFTSQEDVLHVSYLGYEEMSRTLESLSSTEQTLNVILQSSVYILAEVCIVGSKKPNQPNCILWSCPSTICFDQTQEVSPSPNFENRLKKDSSNLLSEVKVYPNPAATFTNIECTSALKSLRVFDQSGKQLFQKCFASDQIAYQLDLIHWNPGSYVMQILDQKGEIDVEKIIIARP